MSSQNERVADAIRVMNAFRAIIRASRTSTRSLEMRFGTSAAQLLVLKALSDGEVGSVKELAHLTSTHNSSASVVVRRLCERGFARRVPGSDDRRRVGYAITPEGRGFLARAPEAVDDRLLAGLGAMSPAEQCQLARLLAILVERADIPLASAERIDQP